MTGLAALCVGLSAVAVLWPRSGRRARRRRILGPVPHRPTGARAAVGLGLLMRGRDSMIRRLQPAGSGGDRPGRGRRQPPTAAGGTAWAAGWLALLAPVTAAAIGVILGGLVAGAVAGTYAAVATRLVRRRRAGRARADHRSSQLDLLAAAAADLRAGLPAGTALADLGDDRDDPLQSRVRAAVTLAERTGAPLAGVLEQIEADARGGDRAQAAAEAAAAGSRATAWLLAGLPFGGIALGYAIGADPLGVLLHTPIGAVCAVGAVGLQLAGLAWVGRIARTGPAVGS